MSTEPLVRVTVLVNRKFGTTEEEFNKYWACKHGPLATDWLQRSGIIEYYHTTSEYKNLGKKIFDATGRVPLAYDGIGDFWVRKYENFGAAFLDPYYQKAIQPDEKNLIDMNTIAVTMGVEYIVLEDGKIIDTHSRNF